MERWVKSFPARYIGIVEGYGLGRVLLTKLKWNIRCAIGSTSTGYAVIISLSSTFISWMWLIGYSALIQFQPKVRAAEPGVREKSTERSMITMQLSLPTQMDLLFTVNVVILKAHRTV